MAIAAVVHHEPEGIDYIPGQNDMIQRADVVADLRVQEAHGAADSADWSAMSPIEDPEPKILLGILADGRLRVLVPFEVNFSVEGPHYIAEAVGIDEFGFGENRAESILDLRRAITTLYFELKTNQSRLGPDLLETWAKLGEAVDERE